MRVGLFGGSFDPVHEGHVRPVREAMEALALERVVYLPTAVPPHKTSRELAPAHRRFAMVELALLDEPRLVVSDLELVEGRPSYTVETLAAFRERWPSAEPVLLLGSDSFAALESWRDWRRIVELAELGVLARPGGSRDELEARLSPELREVADGPRVRFVTTTPVDVSATELRRRLAAGLDPLPGSMAPRVLDYVCKYGLYREPPERDAETSPGA